MEDDFCKVADLIDNAIEITAFICSKLDGGAKAPLKVIYSALQWNLDQGQTFIENLVSIFRFSIAFLP